MKSPLHSVKAQDQKESVKLLNEKNDAFLNKNRPVTSYSRQNVTKDKLE